MNKTQEDQETRKQVIEHCRWNPVTPCESKSQKCLQAESEADLSGTPVGREEVVR